MAHLKYIILAHQLLYQGMFFAKNILLKRKIAKNIRGKNKEAVIAIIIFTIFNAVALFSILLPQINDLFIVVPVLTHTIFKITGVLLLLVNLFISILSLYEMRDSWRVGIIENDKTQLVTTGIYKYSRNPYFLSYILLFMGYTFILANLALIVLSIFSFLSVHLMILKEERFLLKQHGNSYRAYIQKTGRYFLF